MMNRKGLTSGVSLLTCLFLAGLWCKNNAVFVYSRIGGDVLIPCSTLEAPDCSLISWSFYRGIQVRFTHEVSEGQVRADSDRANRLSVTSNCSLLLRDLRLDDIGAYNCLWQEKSVCNVYLSLLTITASSKMTDLQPGGNLILSCILSTFFDTGSCGFSSGFRLSWVMENGTQLPRESRYELMAPTRCNITLVTKLQNEDNNRKWRCQVKPTENSSAAAFQDFTSAFLFQNPSTEEDPVPSPVRDCEVQLPISRIVLCVALPVMVVIVGLLTWKKDRVRGKASADDIEL